MEIKVLHLGHIKTNCWLVSTENAAVVIDPGFVSSEATDFLASAVGKERMLLLTHAHFDHIGGAAELRRKTGVKIGIGETDAPLLSDPELNLSNKFHAHVVPFAADLLFKDGESFKVGDIPFKVILTPGHTVGGVAYLSNNVLFSGDTLFAGAVGRVDLPGGNAKTMKKSLRRLVSLPPETEVYPGHGDRTVIARERQAEQLVW